MNLLTLMKKGCKVVFPSGYWLTGDMANGYIDVGNEFGREGCWNLSKEGLNRRGRAPSS